MWCKVITFNTLSSVVYEIWLILHIKECEYCEKQYCQMPTCFTINAGEPIGTVTFISIV